MTTLRNIVAAPLFLYLTIAGVSADWPQWRGTNRDAKATDTGLLQAWPSRGPRLLWTATGLGTGRSSLAVANGRIFTMGDRREQFVIALRQTDGRAVWATPISTPTYDDAESPGPRGTPTVDGALVYAVGSDGTVVCLETATGKERWRRSLTQDFGGRLMSAGPYTESPLIDGDHVVVTPGAPAAGLVALDKRTGKEVWRAALPASLGPRGKDGAAYSSMVVSQAAGVKQYVQMIGRGLVGVRASDGRVLWHYNRIANDVANVSTPIVRGDHVFASTSYQAGSALLRLTKNGDGVSVNEVYFLGPNLQSHNGGLVLVGEFLYGGHGHQDGAPFCLNWGTGKFMWGPNLDHVGQGSAAVAYADGRLYYRYENGKVLLVEATPEAYQAYGALTIPNATGSGGAQPVISDGSLYLREHDSVYRYDIRRPRTPGVR